MGPAPPQRTRSDRTTALRMGRQLEEFNLVWIEEPLDAYDFEGHAHLASVLDTPIATGEMLASVAEHTGLINGSHCPGRDDNMRP